MKNYHTHTTRCHHAIGNEESYIKEAIQAGYKELGFSDHTPWHYESGYVSHMRMHERDLKDYVKTLQALKEKYKDDISIKIGLEVEYFKDKMPWLLNQVKEYGIDYLILGQHFDYDDEYGIYFGHPLSKKQLKAYVDQVIEGIQSHMFSYVAHPDLANYSISDPYYREQMQRLIDCAYENDIPLEFNLLGYREHRQYPNDVFFDRVRQKGNKVIIGVDAHESQAMGDVDIFLKAYNYLVNKGICVIDTIQFLK